MPGRASSSWPAVCLWSCQNSAQSKAFLGCFLSAWQGRQQLASSMSNFSKHKHCGIRLYQLCGCPFNETETLECRETYQLGVGPKVNSDLAQKSESRIRSPNPKSEKSISAGAPLQQFGLQSEVRIRSPNVFKLKNKTAWPPPCLLATLTRLSFT